MSTTHLEQFYQAVAQDINLQRRLRGALGWENFASLAAELGQENGYSFTAEEVEAVMVTRGKDAGFGFEDQPDKVVSLSGYKTF